MMLELLCSLEVIGQLSVVIPGHGFLGPAGQVDDSPFVFGNSPVEPFEPGIDPDDLLISCRQFGR